MDGMKTVLLCPNREKDVGFKVTARVCAILDEQGISAVLPAPLCPTANRPDGAMLLEWEDALEAAECVVTLGGDGTILHMAKRAALARLPVLGINLGRLGFLTELEVADLPLLPQALAGNWKPDTRLMLEVALQSKGQCLYTDYALNDVVVGYGAAANMVEIEVESDGQTRMSFVGDGLIAATPTGSTAYSLSAGGPVVEPTADCILLTPVCPHRIDMRSIVAASSRSFAIRARSKKPAWVTVDGGEATELHNGDAVAVRRWEQSLTLMRVKPGGFLERVARKLS